jgi:hypothetical protein
MGHGGRRPGSGRPSLGVGYTRITALLSDKQIAAIHTWRDTYQCKTVSEALRQILDALRDTLDSPAQKKPPE